MAHKGTIGSPPKGPGGALGFSDLREILVKQFSGRVWEEIGLPKGFLGTIETITLSIAKYRGKNLVGGRSLQKIIIYFESPLGAPKRVWAFLGQDVGSGLQKLALGAKIPKLWVENPCRIH